MIFDLKDKSEHIPTLAVWHHQEWSYLNPGGSVQTRIEKMNNYLSGMPIPKMFVWVDAQNVIGSAGILKCDMDSKPELTPWLASVFVKPDCREKGIGAALVKRVMGHASEQGFSELFLFTPNKENFYKKLGWQTVSKEDYRGEQVTVMKIELTG